MEALKFTTHNSIIGTSKQGTLNATYEHIVNVLGKPNKADEYKSDAEWEVHVNGIIITIYNWKNGKNYCGENGLDVEDITEWSIGGHSLEVVELINQILFG